MYQENWEKAGKQSWPRETAVRFWETTGFILCPPGKLTTQSDAKNPISLNNTPILNNLSSIYSLVSLSL